MENQMELESASVSTQQPVVVLENVCKSYGSKKNLVCVLKNLNMTVPKGFIYGLLGSSGCGKTTLLNCILGQKAIDEGKVWTLGGPPNSKRSKVPGPSIGYMPQSVGVQPEYTARETMKYFGEIAGMSKRKINERITFLQQLLMLPDLDFALGNLSGGEKRRVSFAIALIHEPELLIIDEPTVGLDPLLRESIWSYLYEITAKHQVTVILTTHYIDEAHNANIVSLLRSGTILAEEPPNNLLTRLGVSTLEEAFFTLSSLQSDVSSMQPTNSSELNHDNYEIESSTSSEERTKTSQLINLKPLLQKNYQWLKKNPAVLIFSIILPAFQIFIFNSAVGHDPINLNLAVVNEETTIRNCSPVSCDSIQLSCNFLQYLDQSKFNLIYYDNDDRAIESVERGDSYASIYLRHNYSLAIKERIEIKMFENWGFQYANIDIHRDISNYHIGLYLKGKLLQNFDSFVRDYLKSCNSSKRISTPIKFNEPVHGKQIPNFAQFAMPALILSSVSFFSAMSTSSALLTEFSNGVTERSLVLGVNPLYLLFAHAISEFVIMILHIIAVIICIFVILKYSLEGSLWLFSLIVLLEGFCGMCFGFMLYAVCTSDVLATYIILGSSFQIGILCGLIWPLEGMPKLMRYIAYCLPFAEPSEALRSIMQRGWGITYLSIYYSLAIMIIWSVIFLSISIFVIKYKNIR